jgi:hypothetical protein
MPDLVHASVVGYDEHYNTNFEENLGRGSGAPNFDSGAPVTCPDIIDGRRTRNNTVMY